MPLNSCISDLSTNARTIKTDSEGSIVMGWNFRRSFKLLPGIRLNVGKTGASISFGMRGLRTTVGKRGTATTVGLPGSGLSFTTRAGATSTTADVEGFKRELLEGRRQIEESPARNAFYQRRLDQHLKSLGGKVPEPSPLVCTACAYERRPLDSGPLYICPMCKYNAHGARARPVGAMTRAAHHLGVRWWLLLGVGAIVLTALAVYVLKP